MESFTGPIMENRNKKNVIIIFAKEPDGKSAKTRIAKKAGTEKASEIYNELLSITSEIIKDSTYCISYSSLKDPVKLKTVFKSAISFFPQIEGDLGEKMRDVFNKLFEMGYKSVTALGTDCPYITTEDLDKSAQYLEKEKSVVLGPASDGGYYLIGCRKDSVEVLNAKKWSTSELFKETLSIIDQKGYNCLTLDIKDDVDEIEDFLNFKKRQ